MDSKGTLIADQIQFSQSLRVAPIDPTSLWFLSVGTMTEHALRLVRKGETMGEVAKKQRRGLSSNPSLT